MEHLTSPSNAGRLETPDFVGKSSLNGRAPRMELYIQVDHGTVSRATFQTFGCGFSIACCSVLTEMMLGQTISQCLTMNPDHIDEALGGLPPNKKFCADMAIQAMRDGLNHSA